MTRPPSKSTVEEIPLDVQQEYWELVSAYKRKVEESKLEIQYRDLSRNGCNGGPYDWQEEFHARGMDNAIRAIIAGNRTGKSRTAAAEVAIHLTGQYPKWWRGRRFKSPVQAMVAGPTNEATRDICQVELFGNMAEGEKRPSGQGWVPASSIVDYGWRQCGVPNVLDSVKVKHVSGDCSICSFKSYEQGPTKFQGVSRDIVWLDEEPEDHQIFTEASTRILDRKGMLMFTRTPLFGLTTAIQLFLNGGPGIWYTTATWANSPHIDDAAKKQLLASYPDYERDCRSKGIPMLGSGAIYTVPNEMITVEPMQIPSFYRRIVGMDFGIDHPTADVWLAYNPDTDTIYVYDAHRVSGETPAYHAQAIKARGSWIPVTWPHDGDIRDKGSGVSIADQYRSHGLFMLPESARYDEDRGGGQSREPIIIEIRERMLTGRFKVFSNLHDWFSEKGMYHRKDGKIVAINDDLLSATHYAVMMLRHAMAEAEHGQNARRAPRGDGVEYDPFGSLRHGAA